MSSSVGCGLRCNRSTAASTIPGVQIPHCAPPCSMNDCCTSWSWSLRATPSIVVISDPFTWATGTRQLFTIRPSTITVHAPHSPSPHPSFVPVSSNCSRNTSSNRTIGNTSSFLCSPLTLSSMFIICAFCAFLWLFNKCLHQPFGHERDVGEAGAGGVFEGVQDGGGGAVHGQLADSFGAAGAVGVWVL